MNHERYNHPAHKKPYEIFGFTEKERLFWRVSQKRFEALLNNEQVFIHEIKESSNTFGEFLFVTTSSQAPANFGGGGRQERIAMTFFGLGFHEYRERWFTEEWFWYQTNFSPHLSQKKIPKEEAKEIIRQRKESIWTDVRLDAQTNRGRLFEMLADLTDDDGALAEMEDLGDLTDWLFSNPGSSQSNNTESPGQQSPGDIDQPTAEQPVDRERLSLPSYVLTFKTASGDVMAWCIQTKVPEKEIPDSIEAAAEEWLLSPDGRKYIEQEEIGEWGFDYANALENVPGDILAKHGIQILVRSHETIELEPDENLLPDELKG